MTVLSTFSSAGATGIEDRLQEGVPECIGQLMAAGIVVWVLTGDKPETAVNIAYSAKLFSPQMEIMNLTARSKAAAEAAINIYLSDIKGQTPMSNKLVFRSFIIFRYGGYRWQAKFICPCSISIDGGVFGRGDRNAQRLPEPSRTNRKRALVIDGKTLT